MAKRQSAFSKALQEAQKKEPETQLDSETVRQSDGETVKPSSGKTVLQPNRETASPLHSEEVKQLSGETVVPQNGQTVKQQNRETVKSELEKTSFYIPRTQLDKLDDLAHEYKKRTGKRINRNDIVRALIDPADLDTIVALIRPD